MTSPKETTRREAIKTMENTARSMLKEYNNHDVIEGIMEALPRLPKFVEHKNIMNSLESRVEASKNGSSSNKELRQALEMVYDEEVEAITQPKGNFGIKCQLGNVLFPRAFLDTSLTSSFITFDVFVKLHKAEITWDKPRKIKHHGHELKVYGMMNNYHVHIGSGLYLMNFMVVKHMDAKSKLSRHDLVFGSDLFFTVVPRFNITNEPLTLANSREIEVNYYEEGDYEVDGRSFIVIPTFKKRTLARDEPLKRNEDIEEGEFLEGDYVESDSELEAYNNSIIEEWIEELDVVKRGDDDMQQLKKVSKHSKQAKEAKEPKFRDDIPLIILSSDDESMDESDANAKWSMMWDEFEQGEDSAGEGFVHYPSRVVN